MVLERVRSLAAYWQDAVRHLHHHPHFIEHLCSSVFICGFLALFITPSTAAPISLRDDLGRNVGLSRSALAERFSEVMGEPIFAFLTRWRLNLAAEYLLTTQRPIEAIAHEAGYESASAFSVAFKRAFGKPPSIWRRKRRK